MEVDDVTVALARLDEAGVRQHHEPVSGLGGTQVLVEDPSGNPIELFSRRR